MMFAVMQLIGGVILSIGWIPQIIQILKSKSVADLNLKSYLLMLLGKALHRMRLSKEQARKGQPLLGSI